MSVLAIDIDLGRMTAVHSTAGVVCLNGTWSPEWPKPGIALIEIAGPILHHEESHSYRRWMIYNAIRAAQLAESWKGLVPKILKLAEEQAGVTECFQCATTSLVIGGIC